MTAWLDDGDVRLYHGDALLRLAAMPSESVHCIVTSPPFWGLRSYIDDQHVDKPLEYGLEPDPETWCRRLVNVFREARRVLRSDGVMWLEVGDTYTSGGRTSHGSQEGKQGTNVGALVDRTPMPDGLKPKDLVGAPWLLAFALRADGWYLRSDTIWARPNPMPESVTDRPTKAHSYVFLLTKSARYFYDADAIREPHSPGSATHPTSQYADAVNRTMYAARPTLTDRGDARRFLVEERKYNPAGRNARSVWSIPTEPTPFAHFATFPQALVERCIKAGTSEHGACSECGAPWRRVVERTPMEVTPTAKRAAWQAIDDHARTQVGGTMTKAPTSVTTGWEPTCACRFGAAERGLPFPKVRPCTVLDPFMGSGTTALVARRLGRHAIGIELNASYLAISAERLQQPTLWSQPAPRRADPAPPTEHA